jgi:hypothetical protein
MMMLATGKYQVIVITNVVTFVLPLCASRSLEDPDLHRRRALHCAHRAFGPIPINTLTPQSVLGRFDHGQSNRAIDGSRGMADLRCKLISEELLKCQ